MYANKFYLIWLLAGAVLCLMELVLPAFVAFMMGISALWWHWCR